MTDLEKTAIGAIMALLGIIASAGMTAFWWVLSKISGNSKALHERIDQVEKEYVRRDDFKEFRGEMREDFREMKAKLETLIQMQK